MHSEMNNIFLNLIPAARLSSTWLKNGLYAKRRFSCKYGRNVCKKPCLTVSEKSDAYSAYKHVHTM